MTQEQRSEAARLMGMVRSQAKTRTARANGKRGGRPKGSIDRKPRKSRKIIENNS